MDELQNFAIVAADTAGVAVMYSSGGTMLVACA